MAALLIQKNFRSIRLTITIFCIFQFIILGLLALISFEVLHNKKVSIAKSILYATRDHLLNNDYRQAALYSTSIGSSDFSHLRYHNERNELLFQDPPSANLQDLNWIQQIIQDEITLPIFYAENVILGSYVFRFNKYSYFGYTLIIWLIIIITSLPFAFQLLKLLKIQNEEEIQKIKNEFIQTSIIDLAHDLKTMIAPISEGIKRLQTNDSKAKSEIIKQLYRLRQGIIEVLQNKKKDSTETISEVIKIEKYCFIQLLEQLIKNLQQQYPQININYKSYLTAEDLKYINQQDFFRACSNIINNAKESVLISKQAQISIQLWQNKKNIYCIVKDNGKGISKEHIHNIFKDGHSFNKPEGTGKGLYQVQQFCDHHFAKISVNSQIDKGTHFKLIMPKIPPHIFQIEDDEFVLEAWRQTFEKQSIIIKQFQEINKHKINILNQKKSSLFFIDAKVGEENGLSFAQELRLAGFQNIFISSACSDFLDQNIYKQFKGIIGKSPLEAIRFL